MLEAIGWFVLGLVLLALGGDSIVKGASGLPAVVAWIFSTEKQAG